MNLGRLQQIDLRKVWLSEPGHFTPWLAGEENLALLADTLGMDLELEAQEKDVGPFRADIVCKDTTDGTLVLIENQLEKTDHTHLGQLMTYAAGLDAVTIVWIAERFTDEHRAALDWLNEITNERVSFFGLEIELWRIGESPIAPKFNVVSKPNDWTKGGAGSGGTGAVTETGKLQREFWSAFREYLAERKSSLKPQKAHPQHWMDLSLGRSNFHLSAMVNTKDRRLSAGVFIDGEYAKRHFRTLLAMRDEIDKAVGLHIDWRELPSRQESQILCSKQEGDIRDRAAWPSHHKWLADVLERLDLVFRSRVQQLPSVYDVEPAQ
jgi:hypothetical protein